MSEESVSPAKNIRYVSPEIASFYSKSRTRYTDFYASERAVMERVGMGSKDSVLDLGCGCGGLGSALRERFGVAQYTGVDINEEAISQGKVLFPWQTLVSGDLLGLRVSEHGEFDRVISFGCIDWNIEFEPMLSKAWEMTAQEGWFLTSVRLTNEPSARNLSSSFQYVNFDGVRAGEIAPYTVLNANEWVTMSNQLFDPACVKAVGYWGPTSTTAVCPYDRVAFSVWAFLKSESGIGSRIEADLPDDLQVSW